MKKSICKALKRYFKSIGIAIKLDDKFLLAIYEFIGIMFFPDSINLFTS